MCNLINLCHHLYNMNPHVPRLNKTHEFIFHVNTGRMSFARKSTQIIEVNDILRVSSVMLVYHGLVFSAIAIFTLNQWYQSATQSTLPHFLSRLLNSSRAVDPASSDRLDAHFVSMCETSFDFNLYLVMIQSFTAGAVHCLDGKCNSSFAVLLDLSHFILILATWS